ncbi:hypothetical protein NUACC26_095020 [Scytonema sp. NUACC26]
MKLSCDLAHPSNLFLKYIFVKNKLFELIHWTLINLFNPFIRQQKTI